MPWSTNPLTLLHSPACPLSLPAALQTALCIHNIAFQGRFWPDTLPTDILPPTAADLFSFEDGYPKVFDETSPADEKPKLPEVCAAPLGGEGRGGGAAAVAGVGGAAECAFALRLEPE